MDNGSLEHLKNTCFKKSHESQLDGLQGSDQLYYFDLY